MGRTNNARSFTLMELAVATTIMVLIAMIAAPKLFNNRDHRLPRATHELALHIKMARDLAMATRRRTWVDFDPSSETYDVYIEHPSQPGRDNRIYVEHPVTGQDFRVVLDQGVLEDVRIDSASFLERSEVEFDRLGSPHNGLGIPLLNEDGQVTLRQEARTRQVRVTPVTGGVREE